MKKDDVLETLININTKKIRGWEALRRNKHYKIDRENAFAAYMERLKAEGKRPEDDPNAEFLFHASPEGSELARKYNLILPFDPKEPLFEPQKDYICSGKVFLNDTAVNIIPHIAIPVSLGDADIPCLGDDSPYLRNGQFLVLAINLQKPKKEIMMEFERQLEYFLSEVKSKKIRGTAIDFHLVTEIGRMSIFKIWDMNKEKGKSPWKITQELYPYLKSLTPQECKYDACSDRANFLIKQPFGNKDCGKIALCLEAQARLKNVKDAIDRANFQIYSIKPSQ